MERRVSIYWTNTAKGQLAELPPKVRKGLLDKADRLADCDDPRRAHKALVGPLDGYYRITYARYRAIYTVEEDRLASGDVLLNIKIVFVAAGKRKERDRGDIYKIAEKMVNMGVIDLSEDEDDEEGD